eukprot:8930927-Pyramimonas_sp.AAC.1
MGHSSPAVHRLFQQAGAQGNILQCTSDYRCGHCMARQRPPKAPNASAKQATKFNDIVYTDVFWIKNSTGKTA